MSYKLFRATVATACSLTALLVAGCVGRHEAARVHGDVTQLSIKDTPANAPVVTAPAPMVRLTAQPAVRIAEPTRKPVVTSEPRTEPAQKVAAAPAALPKVALLPPPSIENVPATRPAPTAVPVAAAPHPALAEPAPAKPAEAVVVALPPTGRPIAAVRQAPAPEVKAEPTPEAKADPKPEVTISAAQPPAIIAKPAPLPPLIRQAAIPEPAAPPQATALVDDQRIGKALVLASDYMKSGRIANARSLLEDMAKSGSPVVLAALAETYDPLQLQASYPKLARTGDGAKALDSYEKAKAAGAKDLEPRIDALRAYLATRR